MGLGGRTKFGYITLKIITRLGAFDNFFFSHLQLKNQLHEIGIILFLRRDENHVQNTRMLRTSFLVKMYSTHIQICT